MALDTPNHDQDSERLQLLQFVTPSLQGTLIDTLSSPLAPARQGDPLFHQPYILAHPLAADLSSRPVASSVPQNAVPRDARANGYFVLLTICTFQETNKVFHREWENPVGKQNPPNFRLHPPECLC